MVNKLYIDKLKKRAKLLINWLLKVLISLKKKAPADKLKPRDTLQKIQILA